MKRRIMILGAGIYQMPLIQRASELGLETVVLSIPGNYPGFKIADHALYINTTDKEAVFKAAKDYNVSGIITTGTDVCLPSIGYVVDKLNLHGPTMKTCEIAQNKIAMKQCFSRFGVSTAHFGVFSSFEDGLDFAKKNSFPVMVKAPDLSGSRGITKAEN